MNKKKAGKEYYDLSMFQLSYENPKYWQDLKNRWLDAQIAIIHSKDMSISEVPNEEIKEIQKRYSK